MKVPWECSKECQTPTTPKELWADKEVFLSQEPIHSRRGNNNRVNKKVSNSNNHSNQQTHNHSNRVKDYLNSIQTYYRNWWETWVEDNKEVNKGVNKEDNNKGNSKCRIYQILWVCSNSRNKLLLIQDHQKRNMQNNLNN